VLAERAANPVGVVILAVLVILCGDAATTRDLEPGIVTDLPTG
jgi:hypothetical protein